MHRQKAEQELERKLKSILSQSTPIVSEILNSRKKLTNGLLITLAIVTTTPLWITWDSKSASAPEPTYYKIKPTLQKQTFFGSNYAGLGFSDSALNRPAQTRGRPCAQLRSGRTPGTDTRLMEGASRSASIHSP